MTNNTVLNTNQAVRLQKMDLTDLKTEAKKLGVALTDTDDKSELISAIIAAGTSGEGSLEPFVLIPLHSRTKEAQELILRARNITLENEAAGQRIRLIQQNQDGNLYTRQVAGTYLKLETFKQYVDTCAVPFEGQETVINDLMDRPEEYEKPAIVRIFKTQNGARRTYMMLAIRKKCNPVVKEL